MKALGFKLFSIAGLLLIQFSLLANTEQIENIDTFIQKAMSVYPEIPSLAITIVKDGKPYFSKAYGYSNIEEQKKATTDTSYYIASTTKSFMGLLMAQLAEEGKIDLNKSITSYAPIKHFEEKSIFEGISIADLLSHTSGISNGLFTWQFASIGELDRKELITLLERKTTSLFNNKVYKYDNFGYNVIDLILSEELGLNWKNLLQEYIFNPLAMDHTSAYISKAQQNNWDIAQPYTSINKNNLPTKTLARKNDATFQAAGGILASIDDIQQWLLLNLNNGSLNGKQLFSESVIKQSHSKLADTDDKNSLFQDTGYAMGWKNAIRKEHDVIYHYGGFDGYFAHISFMPKENTGISILVNESHFGDNVADLIASYSYAHTLNEVKPEVDYDKLIDAVRKRISGTEFNFKADRDNRSDRQLTLAYNIEKYVGNYSNPYVGTLKIRTQGKNIIAELGIMKAIATPSSSDDSIRVEMQDSRGTDILFVYDKQQPIALIYQGLVFYKS